MLDITLTVRVEEDARVDNTVHAEFIADNIRNTHGVQSVMVERVDIDED